MFEWAIMDQPENAQLGNFLLNEHSSEIFNKNLPDKKYKKYYNTFFTNLFCVSHGYKCGYLIDKVSVQQNAIVNIIHELVEVKLISNHIKVLSVHDDVIILNVPAFLTHLSNKQIFVNVSSDLNSPMILSGDNEEIVQIKTHLHTLFECLPLNTKSLDCKCPVGEPLTVSTAKFCVPTVVGLLLNFPIVYWYKEDYNLNCVSLTVYKIIITLHASSFEAKNIQNENPATSKSFELYSFSSPEQFQNEAFVKHFVNSLKTNSHYQMGGVSIELVQTQETVINVLL